MIKYQILTRIMANFGLKGLDILELSVGISSDKSPIYKLFNEFSYICLLAFQIKSSNIALCNT